MTKPTTHAAPPPPGEAAPSAPEAPLLEIAGVSKHYGPVRALDDVSLRLGRGEVLGLCGHNGAGKSSLVRMLVGLTTPDAGEIRIDGEPVTLRNPQEAQAAGVALVDQELSLVGELSVHDNVFLGAIDVPFLRGRGDTHTRARALLDEVGLERIPLERPAAELAIGERQLVEIARLLSRDARIFILDEPTATLSESEIEHVFAVVRKVVARGHSVIYVSHRLGEVMELCDRVVVLRDGRQVAAHEVAELDRPQLVRLIVGELGETKEVAAHPPPADAPMRLDVEALEVPGRVPGFSLQVRAGEIVGLAGQVSSGASEILRALGGLVPDAGGEAGVDGARLSLGAPRRSARAGVVYCSNDRRDEGLFIAQSNERNLLALRHRRITRLGVLSGVAIRRMSRALADLVGLRRDRLADPVGQLSGGNQQKVLVGRALDLPGTKALLFDDPTRGVDVGARAEIHALIRDAAATGLAVVVSSTEMEELLDLCDRVVTLFAGREVSNRPRAGLTAEAVFAEMTLGHPVDRDPEAEHA